MKKIKYLLQLSVLFSCMIVSTGCYTMINSPEYQVDSDEGDNNEIVEESESDTLNVDDNYTIINNYICSDESSCCEHDYCHTDSHSHSYYNCGGHCSLSFSWWSGTWVSYSCNYCHHWSCSGHHHGHFYGHGYFHHDYYHNGYYYGYHDGFYDGYWWGYNDGSNSGGNDNDYSDWDDDSIERRENSYDRTETDDFESQAITFEDRSPGDISNYDNSDESNYIIPNKKNNSNSSSSIIINSIVDSREDKNRRVEKRNNMALDIAQFLFTSYTNSNESSSYKSKSSKNNKSSSYSSKSKSSKNNKSSSYSSKSKSSKNNKSSSYSSKSKSSKKSSSYKSKSSNKSSRSKGRSRL